MSLIEQKIKSEFLNRCRRNPAYSLRAYSKFLGIDQSNLSKVLTGKRKLSKALAERAGLLLGLKPSEIKTAPSSFTELPDDQFEMISGWQHFAIIELLKINKCKYNDESIAQKLGLHPQEVRTSMERLERLNILKVLPNKKVIINQMMTDWSNNVQTTTARKLLQKSLVQKSLNAIDEVDFDFRENGSLTMAINKKKIPLFKKRLNEFRKALAEEFKNDSGADEVYQLTTALFPLTHIN
jgi:uncharacterized protein (TIGR02147 family)